MGGCAWPEVQRERPAERSVDREAWSFGDAPGELLRTRHYRLFLTTDDATLRAVLPGFVERTLTRYRMELASLPAPALKLDTFVMRDRGEWLRLMHVQLGSEAERYTTIDRGGFATGGRGMFWNIGTHDTLMLAAHEGWHQYTQRVFREPLPAWLEETIAVYFEGLVLQPAAEEVLTPTPWGNLGRFDELRRAANQGQLLSLGDLLSQTPSDVLAAGDTAALGYYAQLWSLGLFLTHGEGDRGSARREGVAAVLRDAADGRMRALIAARLGRDRALDAAGVWRAYFGDDLTLAATEFATFTAELLSSGAREAIAMGRDPRDK